MVTILHIDRDYSMTLAAQKRLIMKAYKNVMYITSNGRGIITVFCEGKVT